MVVEESKIISILDMLSERAREFIQVKQEFLEGEGSLAARDDGDVTDWQTSCIISAFINYIGEHERCRYGHYAPDLMPKENELKKRDALNVIERMHVLWNRYGPISLSEAQEEERQKCYDAFLENDRKIKEHLKTKPDLYDVEKQEEHRDWTIRFRILNEIEQLLLNEMKKLVEEQAKSKIETLEND